MISWGWRARSARSAAGRWRTPPLASLEGKTVALRIYTHATEGAVQLFGFHSNAERVAFELLIRANRVGPRLAQSILSGISPRELLAAIQHGNVAALRAVPESKLNAASGTINFCRQLGGAFGINAVVALMERRGEFHADALTATQVADNAATTEYIARAAEALGGAGYHEALTDLLAMEHLSRVVAAAATTKAFQDGFMVIALVFVFAMLPAWVMGRSHRPRAAAGATA